MNDFNTQYRTTAIGSMDMAVDQGLRSFMLGVYNKMGLGLVLSGILAYITSSVPAVRDLLFVAGGSYTIVGLVIAFAPLAVMLISGFVMRNPSKTGANLYYWGIVSLIGMSLGVVMLRFTPDSVASTFFVTAAAFGGLSLFGYTTKKDLTGIGSFLIMALIGLILAMLVNAFLQSGMMALVISAIGVVIFAGLTAYDTQKLKFTYYALQGDDRALNVATTFGALTLYLDFINLFQFLLSFLGNRE